VGVRIVGVVSGHRHFVTIWESEGVGMNLKMEVENDENGAGSRLKFIRAIVASMEGEEAWKRADSSIKLSRLDMIILFANELKTIVMKEEMGWGK